MHSELKGSFLLQLRSSSAKCEEVGLNKLVHRSIQTAALSKPTALRQPFRVTLLKCNKVGLSKMIVWHDRVL